MCSTTTTAISTGAPPMSAGSLATATSSTARWPTARDHTDVRGDTELSLDVAILAGRRQTQGQHLLHRADRDSFADGCRRRASQTDQPRVAAVARLGW